MEQRVERERSVDDLSAGAPRGHASAQQVTTQISARTCTRIRATLTGEGGTSEIDNTENDVRRTVAENDVQVRPTDV
jgi:hypothetical protein